jgi:SAM-dependent methyltransferase
MTFDVAAESYDRFMGGWSAPLASPFADYARVEPGQRVLDVGSGPGSLTTELVARLGADHVAAVDPSEPFVEAARLRHPGVDVQRAAAEALPHPDAAFDAALAQLVVHFMADPVAGLREMARATRPQGIVAACVWDHGTRRASLSPFWRVVRELDPTADDESQLAGARRGHLSQLFRAAGLGNVEETELTVERAFAASTTGGSRSRGRQAAGGCVAGLDESGRSRLVDSLRATLPAGPFVLTAVAWTARGVSDGPNS